MHGGRHFRDVPQAAIRNEDPVQLALARGYVVMPSWGKAHTDNK